MLVFRPFLWEICHKTLQQSWITIKSQHFHPKKSDFGPVHLDQISDKLDYLNCPSGQKFFFHFFSIGQATSSLGKWNWHLLNFFSFTFILAQCVCRCKHDETLLNYTVRISTKVCILNKNYQLYISEFQENDECFLPDNFDKRLSTGPNNSVVLNKRVCDNFFTFYR